MILSLISILTAYLLLETISMVSDGLVARMLGRESVPLCRHVPEPRATIMIIGDSTAVGTGAHQPSQTIAGRLASDFPNTTILNHGINGAGSNELKTILDEHPEWRADILIVHIGGIDLLGLRSLRKLRDNLSVILEKSAVISPRIMLLTSSNLGSIPYFHFPISLLFSWRTRQIRNFLLERSRRNDFVYVDLFDEPADDPFLRDRAKYFAHDNIHPSGDGYGIWYDRLRTALSKHHWDDILSSESPRKSESSDIGQAA